MAAGGAALRDGHGELPLPRECLGGGGAHDARAGALATGHGAGIQRVPGGLRALPDSGRNAGRPFRRAARAWVGRAGMGGGHGLDRRRRGQCAGAAGRAVCARGGGSAHFSRGGAGHFARAAGSQARPRQRNGGGGHRAGLGHRSAADFVSDGALGMARGAAGFFAARARGGLRLDVDLPRARPPPAEVSERAPAPPRHPNGRSPAVSCCSR